ncbi:unnamed protein product [Moneuplotes crassus]|uniref:Uncharacterized protein n=1 Tax=Euplotes crassus TaxID=5936 RepID=A0AAD1URY9_EUPCR|nr:unnamed protein product [Moneuplotes crassus]
MLTFIQRLPYLPIPADYSKALGELSNSEPLELIDPTTGHLRYQGWGKYPNKWLYNPSMSKACGRFKKFWNYFYIISENYLVTMAHTDIGTLRAAYVNIRNIKNMSEPTIEVKVEDFFRQYITIETEKNGAGVYSTVANPDLNMTFFQRPESTSAKIDISGITGQNEIEADFIADSKGYEGISSVSETYHDKSRHVYSHKIQKKFVGDLKINGKSIVTCTFQQPCLGIFDNGRGYFPYVSRWIWPSTTFKVGNHEVLINLGYSQDNPHASFDAVFVDGKLYKLDPLILVKETEDHWKWVKAEQSNTHSNSLKLEFNRAHHHSVGVEYPLDFLKYVIPFKVDLDANYGFYSGEIKINESKIAKLSIKFDDVFGFIEDFHALW